LLKLCKLFDVHEVSQTAGTAGAAGTHFCLVRLLWLARGDKVKIFKRSLVYYIIWYHINYHLDHWLFRLARITEIKTTYDKNNLRRHIKNMCVFNGVYAGTGTCPAEILWYFAHFEPKTYYK
jgi:hypothetical protein